MGQNLLGGRRQFHQRPSPRFAGTLEGQLETVIDSGGNLYTNFVSNQVTATPLPPSVLLLAPALFGLIGRRRMMGRG